MRARRKQAYFTVDLVQQLEDFIQQRLDEAYPYLITLPQLRNMIKKDFRFDLTGHGPRDVELEDKTNTVLQKRPTEISEFTVDKEWLRQAMQNLLSKNLITKGDGFRATELEHTGYTNERTHGGSLSETE
jgi:hypothetical protein